MMEQYKLPYGKGTIDCSVLQKLNPRFLTSRLEAYIPPVSQEELVEEALQHPIGTQPLRELARGKKKVVILASDHTRPVPSKIMIPPMLREIRLGNPEAEVTILIATGCHRNSSRKELEEKFGSEIAQRENIVVHDCDCSEMTDLGLLPSGGRMILNKMAVEADLLVSEGFIEPHFFAGFSGGRKSVLPGVADRRTVLYNHNGQFINSPKARAGSIQGNPMNRDMIFAARAAGLDFICNVVINGHKEIIHAVAGDCEKAHEAGCRFLAQHCGVRSKEADLVVTTNGGYPLDQNIYQAVKGMTAAEAVVRENGVIIIAAKAQDGHGGDGFYSSFEKEKDLRRMLKCFISTPPDQTVVDQWQSQIFARVLCRATVIFISDAPDEMVENFQMIPAHSMEQAVSTAQRILGKETWDTVVIPDGVSVIASAE